MNKIVVRRVDLCFTTRQENAPTLAEVNEAVDLINRCLNTGLFLWTDGTAYGRKAHLIVHPDEVEIECHPQPVGKPHA